MCITCFAQNKATHTYVKSEAVSSEKYQSMTFNGIWSWFSDPRAVYYEGKYKRTYAGWIDNYGDVHIGYYDHDTKKIASTVIYDNLEIDDHDNPSILFDDKGRLLVFFNTHLQDERPLFMRTSEKPEDIEDWLPIKELYLNDDSRYTDTQVRRHTYTNPVRLSKEAGKIYLFWRGIDLKPSFSISTDNGETWSKGEILFMPEEQKELKAPYTKVYSDGGSKIHFTFTDGHPTKEKKNGLYYMYYENGAFYKANGAKIKDITQLPISQDELDVVYQSDSIKSWNWDIAQDAKGNPIVTYAKFLDENTHIYAYASFTNNKWKNYDLITVDGGFPETRYDTKEPEPHYTGGIVIDHETPNTIYLSVKRGDFFEIEQWTTKNNGKSWKVKKITENSTKNNVRPFAIRGAKNGNPLQVLWLQNTKYIYYAHDTRGRTEVLDFKDRYHTAVKMNLLKPELKAELILENLITLLRQVAEQQLESANYNLKQNDWEFGLTYAGIAAFYTICNEERYKNELLNIQQYQTEEVEDVDEDEIDVINIVWSYSNENNRNYLQKIEELKGESFIAYRIDLECASMMYAIRNYKENILDVASLKKEFIKITTDVIKELNSKTFQGRFMRQKALLIYSLAAGINDGLIDRKYSKNVLQAWKELQKELIEKNRLQQINTETTGAILLAGKEIYQIQNSEF